MYSEVTVLATPIEFPLLDRISNYVQLKCVTAWVLRFVSNCHAHAKGEQLERGQLKTSELITAENFWITSAESMDFPEEIMALHAGKEIPKAKLLPFCPALDSLGLLQMGDRQDLSQHLFAKHQSLVLSAKNPLARRVIEAEYQRLIHAGPTLVAASLARHFLLKHLSAAVDYSRQVK